MKRSPCPSLLAVLAVLASSGCRDTPLADNVATNTPPIAHAGEMQTHMYSGSPVTVTLDGRGSYDPDGKIVTYRWFSGVDAPEGGIGRGGPDPDDVAAPTVTLDAGNWVFTLFVVDDEGGTSQASAVMIDVGNTIPPSVVDCSMRTQQTISEDCRLCICGVDPMCEVNAPLCGEMCWNFYGCVQNQCGELLSDMMALADCVRANCSAFFEGVGQYMSLQRCLETDPCTDLCVASVRTM